MAIFRTEDDCSIYYEAYGFDSGKPAVVFLNGTAQTAIYWKAHLSALKDRFRILLYDARGQGASRSRKRAPALEIHVSDLEALFSHLDLENAHLVGLSHGASIALAFAVRFPAKAERLVLCSAAARPSFRARFTARSWVEILRSGGLEAFGWAVLPFVFGERFLRQKERTLDGMVSAIVERNDRDALIAQLTASAGYTPPGEWGKQVRHPVLVISGSDDPMVTPEEARSLAEICGGRHVVIPGAGHTVPAEAPKSFEKVLLEFLLCRSD
jgi:3-oxoadipate enol-lactonase